MRNRILAMTVALTLLTGQRQQDPPKSPPVDVGPGRIAWFDLATSNLPQSKEFYGKLDPAGHPVGMYSRTPIALKEPPAK